MYSHSLYVCALDKAINEEKKKKQSFCFTKTCASQTWSQDTFKKVKMASKAPVLRYSDHKKLLVIQCDANEKGLGASLLQEEGQPLAYTSQPLTNTDTWYSQIEKELLTVISACEYCYQYTLGQHITILTDHRHIEVIMKKILAKWLQNMLIRLQRYDATVLYHPGKKMYITGTLSRAYISGVSCANQENDIREADILVTERMLPKLRMATKDD